MTISTTSLDDLRPILGPGKIAGRDGVPVLSPGTTEDIAAIARHANANNFTIEIAGSGTKRTWGNPVSADIFLDTTHLTAPLTHSWQDLTATVAAGTHWAEMQRMLAAHNQFVALDPLFPTRATVGGVVATNDSGALRHRYGSLRDLIIGMTIVLADGTIAKTGGKVVKNVAGYDLHKLMTGAFGTLGIIAEVTFRLHPLPLHTRTFTVSAPQAEPLGDLLLKILDSHLSTQAIQLRASAGHFALDVQFAALPEVLAQQIAALDRLTQTIPDMSFDPPQPAPADPFTAREKLFASPGIIVKATMLPSFVAPLCAEVVRLAGSAVAQATGILFAHFPTESALESLPSLRTRLAQSHGSLTIVRSPHPPLSAWAVPPSAAETVALITEIKRQFDPNRVLNPNRFLGGI